MFCPNCGTENEEAATPCKKCGFKLRGVSAPKFKGTMLLNSDQAVQRLVQEARRRLEEGSSADLGPTPLPQSSGQPVAWGNQAPGLRTLNGGLQPPRVTSPRVGRTMMGVAPQTGGYTPSSSEADSRVAEWAPNLGQAARASFEVAPLSAEMAPTSSELAAQLEDFPASPVLGLDAVAANDGQGHWPGALVPQALASLQLAGEGSAERAPLEAGMAAGAQSAAPELAVSLLDVARPASASDLPRRLHPMEIVLLLLTFGLYGFVLRARRRKHLPRRAPASGD